ncbi:MAG: hypothetical protein K9M10_01885 [Candidatus Pacebacteria bacterium]|nr:hypothetical protein [Candidatus Paceibacterota bacterium]
MTFTIFFFTIFSDVRAAGPVFENVAISPTFSNIPTLVTLDFYPANLERSDYTSYLILYSIDGGGFVYDDQVSWYGGSYSISFTLGTLLPGNHTVTLQILGSGVAPNGGTQLALWSFSPWSFTVDPPPPPPENGLCAIPEVHYFCASGTAVGQFYMGNAAGGMYMWQCSGISGGTSDSCFEFDFPGPVFPPQDGVCSQTHYGCQVGSSIKPSQNGSTYNWDCLGTNGGVTISCSEAVILTPPPTNSCTGPGFAGSRICPGADSELLVNTPRTLSSSCTGVKCEYNCRPGYEYDGTTSSCEATQCNDGIDNDGDGKIDYRAPRRSGVSNDPGCTSILDNNEADLFGLPKISASRKIINTGATTTLLWNTSNNDESLCSLTGGLISGNPLSPTAGDVETGSVDVTITARTTFTLTCPSGTASVTVDILPRGFET